MLVGYMRVSSDSDRQSTDLQRDALLTAGIDARHLFEDLQCRLALIVQLMDREIAWRRRNQLL